MREKKSQRIWDEKYTFGQAEQDAAVEKMAAEMGISRMFAVLLYNRGYHTTAEAERFLRYEESDFHDPYRMADMDRAVDRILLAISRKEKICIYGDYDVDGVTSVSMFYLYLKKLGGNVSYRIPKREGEGYGVSCAAVDQLAAEGVQLIITVDTGITANEEVAYAKALGMDFVVTDHHECRSELPEACAVVNPHRPDCEYPFKELAGVGVVFKVICACEIRRSRERGESILDGVRRVTYEFADLAAIGTVADVMPVTDENRLIISMGLSRMEKGSRPGVEALIDASYPKKSADAAPRKLTSRMIGFGLAPRINAAGRISDATIAVRLMLAEDVQTARFLAEELCEINRRRQAEENRMASEAYEQIERRLNSDNDLVIVLENNEWQQGIIGIVSSRITERYGLPSVLISFRGSYDGREEHPMDEGKGSGRSVKGMNLVGALTHCEDLLVKYGGHELAAGLTVRRGSLEDFRRRINEYAREYLSQDVFQIHMEADCEVSMRDLSMQFAKEIQLLEPCGTSNATGNATPSFIMKNVKVCRITHTRDGNHTILLLEKDGICLTGMYYGVGEGDLGFSLGDTVDVFFNVEINDYKNIQSVQMIVKDIRLSEQFVKKMSEEKARYEAVAAGGGFCLADDFIPDRSDFARVYTTLRREFRAGNSVLDLKTIQKLINQGEHPPINYTKCKYILRILSELNICEIEELSEDLYRFAVLFCTTKANIEKSSILKRLKSQCIDRVHRDA